MGEISDAEGGPTLDREAYYQHLKAKGIDTEYFRQSARLFKIFKTFVEEYLAYYYPTHADVVADPEMTLTVTQALYQMAFITPGEFVNQDPPGAPHPGQLQTTKMARDPLAMAAAAQGNPAFAEVLYQKYVNMFAYIIFLVTAGHEQVGAV